LKGLKLGLVWDYKPEVSVSSRYRTMRSRLYRCYVQDVCLVNVDYDIRGTIQSYVRSCQPLNRCAYMTRRTCTRDGCCAEVPDKCLCGPGNHAVISHNCFVFHTTSILCHYFVFLARETHWTHMTSSVCQSNIGKRSASRAGKAGGGCSCNKVQYLKYFSSLRSSQGSIL